MAFFHRYREAILCLNRIATTSPTRNLRYFIAHRSTFPFSLEYCTSTSDSLSFMVNYLITNVGFSPEIASKVSKQVRFDKPEKPDSVLALFRNYGFSDSQIGSIIEARPFVLVADAHKTILPKLEFLRSKGASRSDLVHIVTSSPRLLHRSLENCVGPCYDFLKRFFQSHERTIEYIKRRSSLISEYCLADNISLLLDNGVPESKIPILLLRRPLSLNIHPESFKKAVEKVKEMGFSPSTTNFVIALHIKIVVSESTWKRKIDFYKKWGWSEDVIVSAFVRRPYCMLVSEHKIDEIMKFFVTHLGWDSLEVAKNLQLFSLSLQKTILPRASVIQFLQSEGLIHNKPRYITPFKVPEKLFRQKFVDCFKEKSPQLLKLYEEKQNISNKRGS